VPDAVKRLRELIDYFDVTDFVNVTQFAGSLSHDEITRSMRLFAERVMPVLQRDRLFAAPTNGAPPSAADAAGATGIFAPA